MEEVELVVLLVVRVVAVGRRRGGRERKVEMSVVLVVFSGLGCVEERGVKVVMFGGVGGGATGRALAGVGRWRLAGLDGKRA